MAVNQSELFLETLGRESFLKVWTVPNPFRESGKEFADLLIVFGKDILIFSDKASAFQETLPLAWTRWKQRTVDASLKQLTTALRKLSQPDAKLYLDGRATAALPLQIASALDRKIHLISIVRPSHDPNETPAHWRELEFNSTAANEPFKLGVQKVGDHIVHVFEGRAIALLLKRLNTARDFIDYLNSREDTLRSAPNLQFSEEDLLALAVNEWMQGNGYKVRLPEPDADGVISVTKGLWKNYQQSDRAKDVEANYADSLVIDELVNHFHTEFEAGRNYSTPLPSYPSHEQAMRILASESRFGRRIVAAPLFDILRGTESNSAAGSRTFWAGTVNSRDVPNTRYVWLTYPPKPDDMSLEEVEMLSFDLLKQYILVARIKFPERIIVGLGMPGPQNELRSYLVAILDGNIWGEKEQAAAEYLSDQGIFSNLVAETSRLVP